MCHLFSPLYGEVNTLGVLNRITLDQQQIDNGNLLSLNCQFSVATENIGFSKELVVLL